ncbi:sensor histidine kinase [Massilia arenosa]|uniref:histidine kinase n=1 Tax=Zemynaea arenosa TaxID=2561931 RepID=A0A4Y9RUH2_9BURK|nr:ATP-binding protein [Massilia arenosa]TFW11446.1 sensor histidine kinase [Massilia arenosa]
MRLGLRGRLLGYLATLHLVLLGFSVALLIGTPILFVMVEAGLVASFVVGLRLVRRGLEPLGYTQRFHELLQDQDYAARLQHGASAELNGLVDTFNAMLHKLHAERLRIGEQQGFLDRLLEATPSAVVVFDFDGRISLMNASAHGMLELAGQGGRTLAELGVAHPLAAQLDAVPSGEARMLTDAGGRRLRAQRGQFFDRGFRRDFLLVEELTAELEESERATYEKLIRVLAHEVNNTVAATGSVFDSLLFYSAQLRDEDRSDFTTAVDAVKRRNASLGEFIERFTRVVKMPAPELRPVSLAALVDDIAWLYREPCRARGIELDWSGRTDVGEWPLDRQLMEQALVNVLKNAMEAVGSAGLIRLELAREPDGARLSVIDSGNGLAGVEVHRLFEPFFTTKKSGQGIGLLLVREVLLRHGLRYRLAPTGSGETRFDIWFTRN